MQKYNGCAIVLALLYPMMRRYGATSMPSQEALRQEIKSLAIGRVDRSQHFNSEPVHTQIRRGKGQTYNMRCVIIKHSAFSPQSWRIFAEGMLLSNTSLQDYIQDRLN